LLSLYMAIHAGIALCTAADVDCRIYHLFVLWLARSAGIMLSMHSSTSRPMADVRRVGFISSLHGGGFVDRCDTMLAVSDQHISASWFNRKAHGFFPVDRGITRPRVASASSPLCLYRDLCRFMQVQLSDSSICQCGSGWWGVGRAGSASGGQTARTGVRNTCRGSAGGALRTAADAHWLKDTSRQSVGHLLLVVVGPSPQTQDMMRPLP
jgi:hypothetical protein